MKRLDNLHNVLSCVSLHGGRLNYVGLRNVETMEILGSVFNRKGSNTSHVDNNQFYGMECLSNSKHHLRRMDSTHGHF